MTPQARGGLIQWQRALILRQEPPQFRQGRAFRLAHVKPARAYPQPEAFFQPAAQQPPETEPRVEMIPPPRW